MSGQISQHVREAYAAHLERRAARLDRDIGGGGVLAVMNRKWAGMARAGSVNAAMLRAQRLCSIRPVQPDLFESTPS